MTKAKPAIGIILGTGLGGLAREIRKDVVIDYESIPHFPVSTVESHHGRLIFGSIAGKNVVAMQGRFHSYEGYSLKQITVPVRVMKFLGVKTLLISNAAGALNPLFHKGDLMLIADHINLLGDNPSSVRTTIRSARASRICPNPTTASSWIWPKRRRST